jgi:hypothetical protein
LPGQLCVAFPSLHSLSIVDADITDGSLFTSPNTWRALRSLNFYSSKVQKSTVPAIAAALASLPNLKTFELVNRAPAGLAAQMTGLTLLTIVTDTSEQEFRDAVATAAHNPGLRKLTVADYMVGPASADASLLQHLLQSCTTLTLLELPETIINQQGLDVLLQYGTCIINLAVS